MNKDALLMAVEAALAGDWEKSHNIAQEYSDATANWIHAVLHKIEGDQSNSQYWYAHTAINGENAKNYTDFSDANAELKAIAKSLI
jgi:hypothetical protein